MTSIDQRKLIELLDDDGRLELAVYCYSRLTEESQRKFRLKAFPPDGVPPAYNKRSDNAD